MPSFVNNLLSMGVFCNADCSVTFTKHTATVTNKAGTVILTGFRKTTDARMWRFNLQPPWHLSLKPHLACNSSLELNDFATPPQAQQMHIIPEDDEDTIQLYLPIAAPPEPQISPQYSLQSILLQCTLQLEPPSCAQQSTIGRRMTYH